jgi:predicted RNase H-like nuclease (RuvC/YqgF family)
MKTYSVSEAAEIVGIKERAVQYRCKRDNVRKKDNRYLITDEIISLWRDKEAEANAIKRKDKRNNATQSNNFAQLDLEVEALKTENESLKAKLSEYDIEPHERLEVFTNDDYVLFEQRLKEWQMQRQELEHKDKMLELTKKSKDEQISFLSNQLEYQRSMGNKQLEQLETIFEILQGQNKTVHQLNFINAKDKGYDKK